MTKLTTHVLDIYSGRPGKGIKVELFYINDDKRSKLNTIVLNSDGRSDAPLVEKENFKSGNVLISSSKIIHKQMLKMLKPLN